MARPFINRRRLQSCMDPASREPLMPSFRPAAELGGGLPSLEDEIGHALSTHVSSLGRHLVSVRITRGARSPQRSVGNRSHASKDEIAEVWPSVLDGAGKLARSPRAVRRIHSWYLSMDR